jgi:hypothetical protein
LDQGGKVSNQTFDQREEYIKTQARRKRNLKKLADNYHRGKYGDYEDTYEDFYNMYLAPRNELPIPRYASCAEDETYGMLYLFETEEEAVNDQAEIPSTGDTLNVPAGVHDLDHADSKDPTGVKRVRYHLIAMTDYDFATLQVLVQSYAPLNSTNLRQIFGDNEE